MYRDRHSFLGDTSSGMTIVEVMIAFIILIILTAALGTFLSTGLTLWATGEKNKNVYDRAEKIISQIKNDIKNTYTESAIINNAMPAIFLCDQDSNKTPRLRFVISDNSTSRQPQNLYADLYEVGYILDTSNKTLLRGEKDFDRSNNDSIFNDENATPHSSLITHHSSLLDGGVLYISYKFWTQYTTTWDEKVPIVKTSGGYNAQSGPSTIWDSSRKFLRNFIFFTKARSPDQPDFVYPSCMKITLVLEPQPSVLIKPLDAISTNESRIRLERTNYLPAAPSFVKIDDEWIEYKEVIGDAIIVAQRGARNTKREEHSPDSKAAFGYTFTYEIPIPAFRSSEYEE